MAKLDRSQIDSRQFPDWVEFAETADTETVVSPKSGFVLNALSELRSGSWRLRPDGDMLYIEYWNGSSWTEQGRFEV
jgi:hypothetical protein